jgi:hypothetical protein
MERKQGFLFRCVDIVMELFAMTAALSHARRLRDERAPGAEEAVQLADVFCRQSRRKVRQLFRALWSNDDGKLNQIAGDVLKGRYAWLPEGRLDLGFTDESFNTRSYRESVGRPKVAAAS